MALCATPRHYTAGASATGDNIRSTGPAHARRVAFSAREAENNKQKKKEKRGGVKQKKPMKRGKSEWRRKPKGGREKTHPHTLTLSHALDGASVPEGQPTWLRAPATEAEGEVDVLWLDRHAAAVDARAVGIGEKRHNVRLRRLLRRKNRAALEAQALLLRTRHLTHQALEGRLLQKKVRGALELADLAERHGARAPAALCVLHAGGRTRGLGGLLALLGSDGTLAPRRLFRPRHISFYSCCLLFLLFSFFRLLMFQRRLPCLCRKTHNTKNTETTEWVRREQVATRTRAHRRASAVRMCTVCERVN
ncbi:hypothetical protein ECC02_008137 [Trypanosoma cruzi]|uniref:Uncharacterized protein n=1 Tax=Trypanosoma cruzi TaxID=5693 RepID=A0A7J6XXD6_TRYCR|nr:hypothetical protein ECC02_008137 [Trypanosoma cruzi]